MINKLKKSKKIALFGWPACGKSTLGEFLSGKLNINLYSLDTIRYKNSYNNVKDDDKFLIEYEKILLKDSWIIDGNALDFIESRLEQADVLIFFDSDIKKCVENCKVRANRIMLGEETRKNFEGEKPNNDIEDWVINRFSKKIEKLRPILKNYDNKIIIINNYSELDDIMKVMED